MPAAQSGALDLIASHLLPFLHAFVSLMFYVAGLCLVNSSIINAIINLIAFCITFKGVSSLSIPGSHAREPLPRWSHSFLYRFLGRVRIVRRGSSLEKQLEALFTDPVFFFKVHLLRAHRLWKERAWVSMFSLKT